jgi:hypothetical protein
MQRNFWPRILLILSTYIYALSLIYAHEAYLNPVWGYFGFRFSSPTTLHYLMGLLLLTVTASSMPLYTNSCSSMIMTLFYSIVFVPTITVTLCLRPDSLERYSVLLIVMTIGFSMVAALLKQAPPRPGGSAGLPSDTAEVVVIILWIIMAGALIFAFSDMMTLASLTDVYGQRFAARDARIPILAYILAYFSYIVCPTLLVTGLLKKRVVPITLGLAGFLLAYMVEAARTVFLLPLAMILFYVSYAVKVKIFRLSFWFPVVLTVLTVFSVRNAFSNTAGETLSVYLVFRTLCLPGLMLTMYYDLFSDVGFTYWSHIKGLSLFIPAPVGLEDVPGWPGLGFVVGSLVYADPTNNSNANLFASDGAAAAGSLGVIVMSGFLLLWLRIVDKCALGWDQRFVSLLAIPLGIALTNSQLTTLMTSFGGILLPVFLYVMSPARKAGPRFPKPSFQDRFMFQNRR